LAFKSAAAVGAADGGEAFASSDEDVATILD
jgi:hypothetical protein